MNEHTKAVGQRLADLARKRASGEQVQPALADAVALFFVTRDRAVLPTVMASRTQEHLRGMLTAEQREAVTHARKLLNPGGRPKAEDPRTVKFTVRLTPEEYEDLTSKAHEVSANLASYVRTCALGALMVRVPQLNRDAARALAGAANNLNQAQRAVNQTLLGLGLTAVAEEYTSVFDRVRDEARALALAIQGVEA